MKVSNTGFGLPEKIASGLFASATSRCLKATDTLFQTGDTGDGCYRLNSGMLKAMRRRSSRGSACRYQVIDTCTGDLGGPAYRKYDLEAWMPGRGDGGEYGEVTSTSNCTDYQARRLNIRYKVEGQKGTRFVHTLNGTAVASRGR